MKNPLISLGLMAFLAACGGDKDETNPVSGGPLASSEVIVADDDGSVDGIPDAVSRNFDGVAFDPNSQSLLINVGGLDSGSSASTYTRDASLDVPGYFAFKKQDDPLDRFFVAFADMAPDGTSQAFAITDGGQFNRFFGGSLYSRIGVYSQPTSGLVSYAGEYAGSTNLGDRFAPQLLPVPAGTSDGLLPRAPARVRGNVFINVDFADNQINGEIYDRELLNGDGSIAISYQTRQSGNVDMPNITLVAGEIGADGTFTGVLETTEDQEAVGEYAGTFGGTNASSVAAGIQLDRFSDVYDAEEEHGAFALGRCGTAGDSPICSGLGN